MAKKKIVAIVQARLTSTRFKNKIFQKIGNLTIIEIILERLKKSKLIDQIVFAIPSSKSNDKLYEFLKKNHCSIFRGQEKNVLNRYFYAAKKFKANTIIRITSDCPLVDSKLIDKMLKIYLDEKPDYLSNIVPPTFPDGFDVEIFSFKSLKTAKNKASTVQELEHVTPYLKNSNKFKIKNYKFRENLNFIKLSVDKKNDLILIRIIYKYFYPNIFFSFTNILKTNFFKKINLKKIKIKIY